MKFKVVALAASTGGPQALTYIFRHLPVHLPAAYLIVQHLPPSFTRYFADGLAKKTSIEVQVATDGLPLRPGLALIAPSGAHLMVQSAASKHGWCVLLSQEPAVGGHRPSADPLFSSVALAQKWV
jgi:two-component system chemotaxis response regulator CheB